MIPKPPPLPLGDYIICEWPLCIIIQPFFGPMGQLDWNFLWNSGDYIYRLEMRNQKYATFFCRFWFLEGKWAGTQSTPLWVLGLKVKTQLKSWPTFGSTINSKKRFWEFQARIDRPIWQIIGTLWLKNGWVMTKQVCPYMGMRTLFGNVFFQINMNILK